MSNKKILKRVIYTTEFNTRETRVLRKIIKHTGTTKSVLLRALVRHSLNALDIQDDTALFGLVRIGKL